MYNESQSQDSFEWRDFRVHKKALGSISCRKNFQGGIFRARKKVVKTLSVQNEKEDNVDVLVIDQVNSRWSTNIDSFSISLSLTNIPRLFLSGRISPFSFIKPI